MRNHLSSVLLVGLIAAVGNTLAAERTLSQVTLGPISSTAPNSSIRFALAKNTDQIYLQTDAAQMLATESRRSVLANVYVRHPETTLFGPVLATGGNAQAVGLVGTDATGRWLAVQADCRLDHFGSGDCAPIPGATEAGGTALFLIDRHSGDATLITHRYNDPQTPVLDTEPYGDVTISQDGRHVYFHSAGAGLADDNQAGLGARRLYVYDQTLRRSRRADQPSSSDIVPTVSSVLWSQTDGRQALVQIDAKQLLVVSASTGRVTPIGPSDLDPANMSANGDGSMVLRCQRYTSAGSGLSFLQWSRLSLHDDSVLPLNSPPAGFSFAGACAERGHLSEDGNVATVKVVLPVLDPNTQTQPEQLRQWRLSDGHQILITRRHAAPTQASSGPVAIQDVSADGSLIVFSSPAEDLSATPPETSAAAIYLYDRTRDQIKLISAHQSEPNLAKPGDSARLNRAGSSIYFLSSDALTNSPDENNSRDLFAYRIADGQLSLLSYRQGPNSPLQQSEATRPMLSRDGRWLAYDNTPHLPRLGGIQQSAQNRQVRLSRVSGGEPILVSRRRGNSNESANQDASVLGFSADARYVAFRSRASDLDTDVAYQRLGPDADTFVWDRERNVISLVTHPMGGPLTQAVGRGESVAMDASGEWMLHSTEHAGAYVPGFMNRAPTEAAMLVLLPTRSSAAPVLISRAASAALDGADRAARHLAHSPDMNTIAFASAASNLVNSVVQSATEQLYVHDRRLQRTHWLTHSARTPTQPADGALPANAKTFVTPDGRFIAFTHSGSDLLSTVEAGPQTFDCYRYDLQRHELTLVSNQSNGSSQHAYCDGISDDGRYVLYTEVDSHSTASSMQVWRHDLTTLTRTLVSQSYRGTPAFGGAAGLRFSGDGQQALFLSRDSGLVNQSVASDRENLYLRTIEQGVTTLISDGTAAGVNPAASALNHVTASDDFGTIAFADTSSTLVPGTLDLNNFSDVFVSRGPQLSDNPGLSGLWGEAGVGGQGFHLINLPDTGEMLLSWYTYLPLGSTPTRTNQQWLIGLGQVDDGNASFTLKRAEGGAFDSHVSGALGIVGNVTIRFIDCLHAEARYSLGANEQPLTGVIPLTRVSPDTVCSAYQRQGPSALSAVPRPANSRWQYGMSGAWHDAAKQGQGFLMEVLPERQQVLATWFTFDPSQPLGNGGQAPLWLAAIGNVNGNRAHLDVYESVNGRFDQAGSNQLRAVGTLDLDALDCQTSVANYALTLGGVARSGQIPLSRITSRSLCTSP